MAGSWDILWEIFRETASVPSFKRESFSWHKSSEIYRFFTKWSCNRGSTYSKVVGLTFIRRGSLPDSNLFAIVTLWPNMQYRGIFTPTTPAKTEPVWRPIRICMKKLKRIKLKRFYSLLSAGLDGCDGANNCRSFLKPSKLSGGRECSFLCVSRRLRNKRPLSSPPTKKKIV